MEDATYASIFSPGSWAMKRQDLGSDFWEHKVSKRRTRMAMWNGCDHSDARNQLNLRLKLDHQDFGVKKSRYLHWAPELIAVSKTLYWTHLITFSKKACGGLMSGLQATHRRNSRPTDDYLSATMRNQCRCFIRAWPLWLETPSCRSPRRYQRLHTAGCTP